MGLAANRHIGEVTPDQIIEFVETQKESAPSDTDCLFLSCTNWQAVAALGRLQKKLGIPVISGNQARIDHVKHALQHYRASAGRSRD
jgi:maleate isomerase